jgi:hypothetical protein
MWTTSAEAVSRPVATIAERSLRPAATRSTIAAAATGGVERRVPDREARQMFYWS